MVIISYLCTHRTLDALDASRCLYQEGYELLVETFEALIIFFASLGLRKL